MNEFRVDGLVMIGFVLVAALLSVDGGLGKAGPELVVPVLGVRMRDGLGMYDFSW